MAKSSCNELHAKLIQGGVMPALVNVLQSDVQAYEVAKTYRNRDRPSAQSIHTKAVEATCMTLLAMVSVSRPDSATNALVDIGVLPALVRQLDGAMQI